MSSSEPSTAIADHSSLASRKSSLGDDVYETLLSQLITLKIAPGSRITVDQLVREIGVSQTPIRAALIRLENEGLVVKTHNVGYSAAPMPSRSRMEQIYELRMLLEPHAALLAAKRMTKDRKEELLEIVAGMEKPRAKSAQIAYGKFAVKDASFHEWIAQCSGNALIAESLSRLHAHMHLFRLRFHSQVTEDAIEEHSKIVQALTQGDGDKAKKAMLQHLSRSRDRVEPYFLSD